MLTDLTDALSAYLSRIQEIRERRDADEREVAFRVLSESAILTRPEFALSVRLECIRRARIRSGATCP